MAVTINASTTSGLVQSADTTGVLQLQTAGTAAITVDASQKVGIGTTTPNKQFVVSSDAAYVDDFGSTYLNEIIVSGPKNQYPSLTAIGWGGAASGGTATPFTYPQVKFINYRGTPASPLQTVSGDDLARIDIRAYNSTLASLPIAASIRVTQTAAASATGNPSAMGFLTAGATGAATERMRLDSDGYLLIGYTTSNGAYRLQVNSQIFATVSNIATSDARYKTNVEPITSALSLVTKLNPVQFDWKKHPIHNFPEGKTVGFLAQEVQEALKDTQYVNNIIKANECVVEEKQRDEEGNITKEAVKEEFLGIAEGNLIPLLTKAIQEQQTIINDLKARIEALEGAK